VRTTPPIAPMSNALPVRRAGGPRAGSRARVPLGRGAGTPAIAARVVGRYGGFGSRDSTRGVAASARREGMTCLAGLATTASLRRCVRFSSCGRAACGPLGGEREQRAGVRGGAEREQHWVQSTRERATIGDTARPSRCGGFPDHRRGVRHGDRSCGKGVWSPVSRGCAVRPAAGLDEGVPRRPGRPARAP